MTPSNAVADDRPPRRPFVPEVSRASLVAPAPELIDPSLLTEIAAGLAHALSLEDPPPERTPPQLLLRTNRYTAWYLGWSAEHRVDRAATARGVLHVVHGELVERRDAGPSPRATDRVVHAGDAIVLGDPMATRIENAGDVTPGSCT